MKHGKKSVRESEVTLARPRSRTWILCFGNGAAHPMLGTARGGLAVDTEGTVVFDRDSPRIEVCGLIQLLRIRSRLNVGIDWPLFSTCFGF
jgi:hypothetical protein